MKMYDKVKSNLSSVAVAVFLCLILGAARPEDSGSRPSDGRFSKTSGAPLSTMLNINRVAAWYSSDSKQEQDPSTGNSGLFYPRGTSTAIFSSGIVWSGQFNDGLGVALRVNGASYNTGMKVGRILGMRTGVTEDPNSPDVRIWRIRRDWETADLRQDAAELNSVGLANVSDVQIQAVRDQYQKDYLEWPWQKGAPYYERNGTPGYQPDPNAHFDAADSTYDEPGAADADQVIWYVCNDIGANPPWASPEAGMEMQATIWGYNRTDALGNTIFKKFRLIYKGTAGTTPNARIDSMYVCQWSDPDLGSFTDDLVGCDTSLSLGYVYNGNRVDNQYSDFGLAPPASGFDFLQGPLVRGVAGEDKNRNGVDDAVDFAVFDLKRVGPGFINLPMTSFLYWAQGNTIFTDPPFTYEGAKMWESMLRGYPPRPTPPPYPAPILDDRGLVTTYMFPGDPSNTNVPGWLDGNIPGHNGDIRAISGPSDRRLQLSSGPFAMALGDTQEVVSAWVGGSGKDRFGSVKVMKFNDASVQLAYDNLFALPKAPDPPKVRITALDGEVILEWDVDSVSVAKTENTVGFGGYLFEGYNVNQFNNAAGDLSTAKLVATYDIPNGVTTILQKSFDPNSGEILLLPVQLGLDNGIKRYIKITNDAIRGGPLVNGQSYFFSVTGYNHLPAAINPSNPLRSLEGSPQVISVVPEKPRPGTRLSYAESDTVAGVTNLVGVDDARVNPVIFNQLLQVGEDQNRNGRLDLGEDLNGNGRLDPSFTYEVRFDSTSPTTSNWSLFNATSGKYLFKNITDLSGTTEYRVTEQGFTLYVASPLVGIKSGSQVLYNTDATEANILLTPNPKKNFLVAAGSLTEITGGKPDDQDVEIRFGSGGGWALIRRGTSIPNAAWIRVPFQVWNIGNKPGDPTTHRIFPLIIEEGTPNNTWDATLDTAVGGKTYRVFDAITTSDSTYRATYDADTANIPIIVKTRLVLNTASKTGPTIALWQLKFADLDGDGKIIPAGDTAIVRFPKYKAIRNGDVKMFTPSSMTVLNSQLAKSDVDAIKVFPNPYYGLNTAETNRVNRFVTFSHLPDEATIRIFNLAGTLVRTLIKNDPPGSAQFLQWDLQNENQLPIASGIYIAYIDMPGVGTTKTLKIAIIQEQQFLRNY